LLGNASKIIAPPTPVVEQCQCIGAQVTKKEMISTSVDLNEFKNPLTGGELTKKYSIKAELILKHKRKQVLSVLHSPTCRDMVLCP
jgi:hypothetical protein